MKIFLVIGLLSLNLIASFFGNDNDELREVQKSNRKIHQQYRNNVNDANSIIKRGEYSKINHYKSDILHIITQINTLEMEKKSKKNLQNDMDSYVKLIDKISSKLQSKAPLMNTHYQKVIYGLQKFNSKLSSIGLSELLSQWRELSRIKNRFVRKPSSRYRKEFDAKWTSIIVTITELYIDEEDEEELFAYLENYKSYFHEVNSAYADAGYKNINRLKPLTYKIKAQLELLVPYSL